MNEDLEQARRMVERERARFWTDVAAIGDKLREAAESLAPAIGEVSRADALAALEREVASYIERLR